MDRDVSEQDLPGIGRRYELVGIEGTHAVVVLHHSGRRELYLVPPKATEPAATLTLTDRQARNLGAILGGAYFTPAVVDEMDAVIGDLLIDWVTLSTGSPAAGRSIADLEIRRRTRMTVAAIARAGGTIIAPEPHEVLEVGDRLVVVGRREDLAGFIAHVVGPPGG
jgi:TrkA domain protein